MKKTPGWGSQSSLSQSPREVGGGAWAGPQIFIVLISSFLQPGPWAAELGTLAEQSHGQSVTCVGSGAPSGWGLGERVQHTLAVQLACFLAIPLWEMGQAVAQQEAGPSCQGPEPTRGRRWVMRLEHRGPRQAPGRDGQGWERRAFVASC